MLPIAYFFLFIGLLLPSYLQASEQKNSSKPQANSFTKASEVTPREFGAPKGPLTLENCFELAVIRSETLGMREADIRFAQALYWETIASTLPQVSISVGETLRDKRDNSSFNFNSGGSGSGSGAGAGSNFSNTRRDQFQTRISIKQPIFSGFRDWNLAAANKAETQARSFDKTRAYQLLYLDVNDAFYQTYYYQADLKALENLRDALEKRQSELNHRIQLGRSRKGEALLTQSELADVKATIESVRGLLFASKEVLAFLTGLPSNKLELIEKNPLPAPTALEKYLATVEGRPDLLSAIESRRAARKRLSAAKGERFGSASLQFDFYPYQNPESSEDWTLFLKYELPIFDGGIIESRIRQQKALFESSQLQLQQLKRSSVRDVRIAFAQFNSAVQQIVKLREEYSIVEENLDVQNQDYHLGRISNLDAIDALRRVHETRRKLLSAESDLRVALARLHVQAGQIPSLASNSKLKIEADH